MVEKETPLVHNSEMSGYKPIIQFMENSYKSIQNTRSPSVQEMQFTGAPPNQFQAPPFMQKSPSQSQNETASTTSMWQGQQCQMQGAHQQFAQPYNQGMVPYRGDLAGRGNGSSFQIREGGNQMVQKSPSMQKGARGPNFNQGSHLGTMASHSPGSFAAHGQPSMAMPMAGFNIHQSPAKNQSRALNFPANSRQQNGVSRTEGSQSGYHDQNRSHAEQNFGLSQSPQQMPMPITLNGPSQSPSNYRFRNDMGASPQQMSTSKAPMRQGAPNGHHYQNGSPQKHFNMSIPAPGFHPIGPGGGIPSPGVHTSNANFANSPMPNIRDDGPPVSSFSGQGIGQSPQCMPSPQAIGGHPQPGHMQGQPGGGQPGMGNMYCPSPQNSPYSQSQHLWNQRRSYEPESKLSIYGNGYGKAYNDVPAMQPVFYQSQPHASPSSPYRHGSSMRQESRQQRNWQGRRSLHSTYPVTRPHPSPSQAKKRSTTVDQFAKQDHAAEKESSGHTQKSQSPAAGEEYDAPISPKFPSAKSSQFDSTNRDNMSSKMDLLSNGNTKADFAKVSSTPAATGTEAGTQLDSKLMRTHGKCTLKEALRLLDEEDKNEMSQSFDRQNPNQFSTPIACKKSLGEVSSQQKETNSKRLGLDGLKSNGVTAAEKDNIFQNQELMMRPETDGKSKANALNKLRSDDSNTAKRERTKLEQSQQTLDQQSNEIYEGSIDFQFSQWMNEPYPGALEEQKRLIQTITSGCQLQSTKSKEVSRGHPHRQGSGSQYQGDRQPHTGDSDGICRKPQSRLVNPLILLSQRTMNERDNRDKKLIDKEMFQRQRRMHAYLNLSVCEEDQATKKAADLSEASNRNIFNRSMQNNSKQGQSGSDQKPSDQLVVGGSQLLGERVDIENGEVLYASQELLNYKLQQLTDTWTKKQRKAKSVYKNRPANYNPSYKEVQRVQLQEQLRTREQMFREYESVNKACCFVNTPCAAAPVRWEQKQKPVPVSEQQCSIF